MLRITLAALLLVAPFALVSADAANSPPSGKVKSNNACGATPQLDNCRLRKTRA